MRFFGIPIHPALVHFPIALWAVSLICDLVFLVQGARLAATLSGWAVWGGVIAAMPAMLAGLMDLRRVDADPEVQRTLNLHMLLMFAATSVYALQGFIRGFGISPVVILVGNIMSFGLLTAGAHYGGKLVYKFGVGVQNRHGESDDGKNK